MCDKGAEIDYNIHDYIVISVKSSEGKNLIVFLTLKFMLHCIITVRVRVSKYEYMGWRVMSLQCFKGRIHMFFSWF